MLSRVADSLYWLGRYVERAENLARMVDVNHYNSLDSFPLRDYSDNGEWLIYTTNSQEPYSDLEITLGHPPDINEFILFADENPDSVKQCISQARTNGRMVRDQISSDMWLELNSIHLFIKSPEAYNLWQDDPQALLKKVINFSLLFQGLTEATNQHDEGWNFMQLAKYIERADKTSRILDTLTYHVDIKRSDIVSILHSCSGFSSFYREYRGQVSLSNAIKFLLCSSTFPRSVRFCLRQMDFLLHSISGVPFGHYSNEAERITGKLLAQLNYSTSEEIDESGLHQYIDTIQIELNEIGQNIFETYVLIPSEYQESTAINQQPGQQAQ
ncbi:uncharacterized protein Rv2567 [Rubritalea halochordaticola]|uniref:Uncharacterized protein Rv2567 n=1 Tax=Rubritalea halochordaticola TaxID=714537 RepID=A0ABP9UZ04_9BACT